MLQAYIDRHRVSGWVSVDSGYVLRLASDPERLRGPDVSYVTEANLLAHGGAPAHGFMRVVPDLVVEVDSTGRRPRVEKRRIQNYLDVGVRLLWVVHTRKRTATVYRPNGSVRLLAESDVLEGEDVIPGLSLPLREVFERIPPET